MKSRREWETEIVNKMLDEPGIESLPNILSYAAWFLHDYLISTPDSDRHACDKRTMEILEKYVDILLIGSAEEEGEKQMKQLTPGEIAKELLDNKAIRIGPWVLTMESSSEFILTCGCATGQIVFDNFLDAVTQFSFLA